MNKIVMVCGPAGAGKSTYIADLVSKNKNTTVFSSDARLIEMGSGTYVWTSDRAALSWGIEYERFSRWCLERKIEDMATTYYRETASADHVAVWDGTFTSPPTRSPVLHFGKGFGFHVEAIACMTLADECIYRNSLRPVGRRVPEDKIVEMIRQFSETPPQLWEGFDAVTSYGGGPRLGVGKVIMINRCEFYKADRTRCESVGPDRFCEEHSCMKCSVCGGNAAYSCSEVSGSSVCRNYYCGSGACYRSHHTQVHHL